jgi:hypothetical protein
MSVYRCCFVRDDGRIRDVAVLECADDREATSAALRLFDHRPAFSLELWQRDRLVFTQSDDAAPDRLSA